MPVETQGPAEAAAAAQLAGRGPRQPKPRTRTPEATAAVALAALAKAGVPTSPAVAPTVAGTVTYTLAAAAVLQAFDGLIARRRDTLVQEVTVLVLRERPSTPVELVRSFVDEEIVRERVFVAKARARLEADLPAALAIEDKAAREARVRALLDREARYLDQREDAIKGRVRGMVMALSLEQASPEGAYWRLSDRPDHCERCLALAGKIWPWSVLRLYRPPMHPNCGCGLHAKDEAIRLGWASEQDVASADDLQRIMYLLESAAPCEHEHDVLWGPSEQDARAAILRAWEETGTHRADAAVHAEESGRLLEALGARAVPIEAVSVLELHEQLDVMMLKVEDLRPRDRIMVDGVLRRVDDVRARGLLNVDDVGLVFIPRDLVRGIPAPPLSARVVISFEQAMAAADGKQPAEAVELAPMVYYSPTADPDQPDGQRLVVGPAFFTWSRPRRRAVVFGYFAERVADFLGLEGVERAAAIRTYLAVTVGGDYEVDVACRARVLEAARALGLPGERR